MDLGYYGTSFKIYYYVKKWDVGQCEEFGEFAKKFQKEINTCIDKHEHLFGRLYKEPLVVIIFGERDGDLWWGRTGRLYFSFLLLFILFKSSDYRGLVFLF